MIHADLITQDIVSKGYHIIDNFLAESDFEAVQHYMHTLHTQGQFKAAKIGRTIQLQQNKTIRNDTICWLSDEFTDPSVQIYLNKTTAIAQHLNRTLYLGLQSFETHFSYYAPGSFYKKHVDQFANTFDRKISCVYYLNASWHAENGGELRLFDQSDKLLESVVPHGNRFICFNSELSHEVGLTQAARYSMAGWMKTRSFSSI